MQTQLKKISALLLTLLLVLSLVACGGNVDSKGTATVVVGETAYTVNLSDVAEDGKGLLGVLDVLEEKENLTVTAENGLLTQVGDLKQDSAAGVYLFLYTSVEKDADVSQYATTTEWNGNSYTSSGVGAAEMTVEDGAVIIIRTIKW